MKKIILFLLSKIAKDIILRQKPFVVGITGTVGKTTATNFVYEFLNKLYPGEVYKSEFDYNGEYGLPLTILQSKSPNKNILLWLFVFCKGLYLTLKKGYPKYLVLEYGIDHIGEMKFLLDVVRPDIGIILNISPNHVTQFPDYNDYINEKLLMGNNSKKIIFNIDDSVLSAQYKNKPNSLSFGVQNDKADIKAKNIVSSIDNLNFDIISENTSNHVQFSLIGDHQTYNILPIYSLAKILNISPEHTTQILQDIHAQKGRGTILRGANDASIIDGSYNGGFLAISTGVKYMKNLEGDYNKILFLGDMRELGPESKKLHTELASIISDSGVDYVVLVGEEMNNYVLETVTAQYGKSNVFWFKSSRMAGEKVREIIQNSSQKSVIYVKGSQNTIFLEEGIKKFLFNLQDASKLCRQSPYWLSIKEDFFSQII